jgi:hypothetical protein
MIGPRTPVRVKSGSISQEASERLIRNGPGRTEAELAEAIFGDYQQR